jgi:hypothetical protein
MAGDPQTEVLDDEKPGGVPTDTNGTGKSEGQEHFPEGPVLIRTNSYEDDRHIDLTWRSGIVILWVSSFCWELLIQENSLLTI